MATLKTEVKLLFLKTKWKLTHTQESIPMAGATMKHSAKYLPMHRITGEKNQTLLEQILEYLV